MHALEWLPLTPRTPASQTGTMAPLGQPAAPHARRHRHARPVCRRAPHRCWQLRPQARCMLAWLHPTGLCARVRAGMANGGPGSAGSSPRAPASAFAIGVSQDSTQLRATSLAPLSAERAAVANGIA